MHMVCRRDVGLSDMELWPRCAIPSSCPVDHKVLNAVAQGAWHQVGDQVPAVYSSLNSWWYYLQGAPSFAELVGFHTELRSHC